MRKNRQSGVRGIAVAALWCGLLFLALAVHAGFAFAKEQAEDRSEIPGIKKEYTLEVKLGPGVTGTPSEGQSKYKAGTTVKYIYFHKSNPKNLIVTLDGKKVAVSGTIVMNRDHVLSAKGFSIAKFFALTVRRAAGVNGLPVSGTILYEKGATINYNYSAAAGYGGVKVKLDGVTVPVSGAITMNANHELVADPLRFFTLQVWSGGLLMQDVDMPNCMARGTPACGTHQILEGTVVNFNYENVDEEEGYAVVYLGPFSSTFPPAQNLSLNPAAQGLCQCNYAQHCQGSFVMNQDCLLFLAWVPD